MVIFQNFQRGYHYLILDQKLTTQENQKFTKGVVHLRNLHLFNFRPKTRNSFPVNQTIGINFPTPLIYDEF